MTIVRWLFALLIVVAAGCSSSGGSPYVPRIEHDEGPLNLEVPDSADLQYMAFCFDEKSAVTPWVDSRGEAEGAGGGHVDENPNHRFYVLWRQKP